MNPEYEKSDLRSELTTITEALEIDIANKIETIIQTILRLKKLLWGSNHSDFIIQRLQCTFFMKQSFYLTALSEDTFPILERKHPYFVNLH